VVLLEMGSRFCPDRPGPWSYRFHPPKYQFTLLTTLMCYLHSRWKLESCTKMCAKLLLCFLKSKEWAAENMMCLQYFFSCDTGVWTQSLHLELLRQPFFVKGFWDRTSGTICLGWLWTSILLISASWVAGITGVTTGAWLKLFF
jgi:hypothetical protein